MRCFKYKQTLFFVLVLLVVQSGCSNLETDKTKLKPTQQIETEYLSIIKSRLNESTIKEGVFDEYYNNTSLWTNDQFMSSKAKGLVEFYEKLKDEHDSIMVPLNLRAFHVAVAELYEHRIKNWKIEAVAQSNQKGYGNLLRYKREQDKKEFSMDLKLIYEELKDYSLNKRLVG